MNRGVQDGKKRLALPDYLGVGDPANDGKLLQLDSTQPGGVKVLPLGTFLAPGASPAGLGEWFVDAMSGATDDAKFQAALTAWNASAAGGTIRFGNRTYTMTSQWSIPNDGASPPKQKSLVIDGVGAWRSGDSAAFDAIGGGTIIDHQYNGTGPAKIDTRGHGLIEITDRVTLTDSSGGNLPFFQATLTTPIVRASFIGSKTGQACDQDAVILGGGGDLIDGTATAKFDGYGGEIDIFCDGIRECVRGNPACNGMPIRVVAWIHCGSPDLQHGAIHLVGDVTKNVTGNEVRGLIETTNYPVSIICDTYAKGNDIQVDIYDAGGTVKYYYWFGANATTNVVHHRFASDSGTFLAQPYFEDPTVAGQNTFVTGHAAQRSIYPQPQRWLSATLEALNASSQGVRTVATTGDQMYWVVGPGANPDPTAQIVLVSSTQVTDAGLTSGSNVVTSATAAFTSTDINAPLNSGANFAGYPVWITATYTTSTAPAWTTITTYTVGQVIRPTVANGHMYQCTVAGISGASQPTFPTDGTTVVDGTATWKDMGAVTAALCSANATATATNANVKFGRAGTTWNMTTFARHHIISSGNAPSTAADAGAGTAPSAISTTGTDLAFTVNITSGTATAAGQMFHTNAATSWAAAPHFNVTAGNSAAATLLAGGFWWTTTAAGQFQLNFVNAPAISTAYIFNVTAIG